MPFVNAIRNMFRNRRQEREAEERRREQSRLDREAMLRRASTQNEGEIDLRRIEPLILTANTDVWTSTPIGGSLRYTVSYSGGFYGTTGLYAYPQSRNSPRDRAEVASWRSCYRIISE